MIRLLLVAIGRLKWHRLGAVPGRLGKGSCMQRTTPQRTATEANRDLLETPVRRRRGGARTWLGIVAVATVTWAAGAGCATQQLGNIEATPSIAAGSVTTSLPLGATPTPEPRSGTELPVLEETVRPTEVTPSPTWDPWESTGKGFGPFGEEPQTRPGAFPVYEAEVLEVLAADMIRVRIPDIDRVETVRPIGVSPFPATNSGKDVQCIETTANDRARGLLEGKSVALGFDPTAAAARDRAGNLLAFVILLPDEKLYNLLIVLDGYALALPADLPDAFRPQFETAQEEAEKAESGLWSPMACRGEASSPGNPLSP
jgi:endonuclease YncB( thermonuclease family)